MDISQQPIEGQRPIQKRPQQRPSARPLSPEYIARELAERITAVVVTGLDGFLVADSPAWPGRLEKIEKEAERLLAAERR